MPLSNPIRRALERGKHVIVKGLKETGGLWGGSGFRPSLQPSVLQQLAS